MALSTPNPRLKAPTPIIDNLKFIGNPFKQHLLSSVDFTGDTSAKAPFSTNRDLEYSLKFLYSYNGSTATYNSYRREVERLLQWCWRIEQVSLLTLKREHIEEFMRFCANPPKAWIGTKNVARFKTKDGQRLANQDWRPFVVSVSKS